MFIVFPKKKKNKLACLVVFIANTSDSLFSLAAFYFTYKLYIGCCNRGPAHGDIFRIFPSGSSHVRGQQCTVAIEEKRFSHRGAATQAVILKTVCLL